MGSFSGWTEGILLSLLFLIGFAAVISGMNALYNESYDGTMGLATHSMQEAFNNYQKTIENATTGKVQYQSVTGLTLFTSWDLIKATGDLVWSILSGGFVEDLVNLIHLPSYFALIFRILYFISIGFIILFIIFRVKV